MLESGVQSRHHLALQLAQIVVLALFFFLGGTCSSSEQGAQQSQSLALPPNFPLALGMTWDECVPILKDRKRLTPPAWETPNRYSVTYKIGDGAFSLTFERPTAPDLGPYRIIKIAQSALPPPGPSVSDISRELRPGMTLDEALPLMKRVGGAAGGFFAFETRDRLAAVLQTDDSTTVRVTFQRPNDVPRPEVIADATPQVLQRMNHIPLDALPEFGRYRVVTVKKTDPQ